MRYPRPYRVAVCLLLAACHSACAHGARRPATSATVAAAEESVTFAMLEARFEVTDEWLLSVAAAYLDAGPPLQEAQLRLGAIGAVKLGTWSLENRHLFSFSSASVERYRMR